MRLDVFFEVGDYFEFEGFVCVRYRMAFSIIIIFDGINESR